MNAQRAGACKHGIKHRIRSGKRAGVGRGSRLTGSRGADLQCNDRLAGVTRLFQACDQAAGVAAGFETAQDHPRRRVARQKGDAIGNIDVAFVPGGHETADADAALAGKPHREAAEIAALGHDAERTRDRQAFLENDREGGDALVGNADRAETVRPQDPHAGALPGGTQSLLQRSAGFAQFSKARGEHDDAADPARGALLDGGRRLFGLHRDQGQIRRLRYLHHRWIGLQPLHFGRSRIDRIDLPGIAISAQQMQRPAADLGRILRRTDDRDRARPQQRLETFAHAHV